MLRVVAGFTVVVLALGAIAFVMLQVLRIVALTRAALARELMVGRSGKT